MVIDLACMYTEWVGVELCEGSLSLEYVVSLGCLWGRRTVLAEENGISGVCGCWRRKGCEEDVDGLHGNRHMYRVSSSSDDRFLSSCSDDGTIVIETPGSEHQFSDKTGPACTKLISLSTRPMFSWCCSHWPNSSMFVSNNKQSSCHIRRSRFQKNTNLGQLGHGGPGQSRNTGIVCVPQTVT